MTIGPAFGGGLGTTIDPFFEVSKRNIPGHRWQAVLTRINSTIGGDTIEDWSSLGGESNILFVNTPETWEIVSDSNDDTAAGIGARVVNIISLDADHNEQVTPVTLNGQTPVTITGTHIRPRQAAVAAVGSTLRNQGNIIVRVAGTVDVPNVRNYIVALQSFSKESTYTVPAGKSAFIKQTTIFCPKNQDGVARNVLKNFGSDSPILVGLDIPFYQNAVVFPVQGPFLLPEKSDIIFQVSTMNPGVELQSIVDLMVVDNEYIGDNL